MCVIINDLFKIIEDYMCAEKLALALRFQIIIKIFVIDFIEENLIKIIYLNLFIKRLYNVK